MAFNISGEDNFTSQDKQYLLLEEIQNSNTCQKADEDATLPHTCLILAMIPEFITQQYRNETSSQHKTGVTNKCRLVEYFCSNTIFNFSTKALFLDIEIKALQKGLGLAPIQNKINKTGPRSDFVRICTRTENKMTFQK